MTVPGQSYVPLQDGVRYHAFFDASGGGGQDSAVLCVSTCSAGRGVVCRVDEFRPPFSSVDVAGRVAGIVAQYRVTRLVGDNFSGGTWADILKRAGVRVNLGKGNPRATRGRRSK